MILPGVAGVTGCTAIVALATALAQPLLYFEVTE